MKTRPSKTVYILPLILIPVLIILDRITKVWAVKRLAAGGDIVLIPGVLRFRHLQNAGAAFGVLKDSRWLFIAFTVIVLAVGVYFYIRCARRSQLSTVHAVICSALAAGAIGNGWDRAVSGTVTDFIYVELIDFPIFNLADIYITCACAAAVILVLRSARHEEHSV